MKKWILSSVFAASTLLASATVDLHYGGEALVATGTGDFAPYYTSALRHGRLTQSTTLLGEVSAWVPLRLDRRFSWGACVDLVADYGSSVEVDFIPVAAHISLTVGGNPPAISFIR